MAPPKGQAHKEHAWWKEAVVYQVYPASFCDSNGDGWGDVKGITSKLDHIKELGANIVWTSPIYKSPQIDMGYDIADYKDIDYRYGTMADVDELIAELEKRDMKLMMDLVVNHTSDLHEWFIESRSSTSNPKRDWYIWKKPKFDEDGNRIPPNNWAMILGEENSAWNWDEKTGEYYLALFCPQQPDLNWENPDVREAVYDVMRFWLDKGVCGFRMDVINHISKHQDFPDAPVIAPDHKYQPGFKYYANGPRMHEWLKEMYREALSHYDTITVGEMPFIHDEAEILRSVGAYEEELRMIFIFSMVDLDDDTYRLTLKEWSPSTIKRILNKWQTYMIENDGWNSVFWENHDNARSVSRYTDDTTDRSRELGAKLLALMHSTLQGTSYIYQGQEIGMKNVPMEWEPKEYLDVETQNYWKKMQNMYPDNPEKLKHARVVMQKKARDHARTPVQWSAAENAGFCAAGVTPWMRVNDDYETWNAEVQRESSDPNTLSVFQFWKRAFENRQKHKDAFVYGGFKTLDMSNPDIFTYVRTSESDGDWIVVLNFRGSSVEYEVPSDVQVKAWVAGNYTAGKPEQATSGKITLQPWEGFLGQCA